MSSITLRSSSPSKSLEETVGALRERLGDRVTTGHAVREHHSRGETYMAGALPDAVVFPTTTDEVSAVVAICARTATPIVPFGAGSSLEGHVAAVHGGVCVDLTRMNRILRISADDLDATVEAGVTRLQLDRELRKQGVCFFVDPGADATLGGMASTRASGTTAVRYGTMRENVLGLRAVMADGRIVHTGTRARKSAAGYDLTRLLVGSEGTLAVITELTLRLQPIPEAVAAAVCGFPDIERAVTTVIAIMQTGTPVARIELLDDRQIDAINRYSKTTYSVLPTLFFEFHGGSEREVADHAKTVDACASEHGGRGFEWVTRLEDRNRLWKARHDVHYATMALRPGARSFTTDVCVPISQLAACILDTQREARESRLTTTLVGHVGDGNFHMMYLVDPADEEEIAEARRLSARVVERALALGGTCSGEHGIGLGKISYLEAEHGEALNVMRTIKRALDPLNIMNPGKMLIVDPPA
jgi:D-lactate dehydrogenase (cytochrome)